MRTKSIVILVILAVLFPMACYAQRAPDKRSRIERQQDSRYLVYVSGIT